MAGRVFGREEKRLRMKPTLATKEYYSEYDVIGEVRKISEYWSLINPRVCHFV